MKKKILTWMLISAVSVSVLAGCGNAAEPADSGSVVATEEPDGGNEAQEADGAEEPGTETSEGADAEKDTEVKDESEDADTEKDAETEYESQEADAEKDTGTEPEESEQESVSWLEEHGVTITPQGDSSVKFYSYDSYPEDYVDDFVADLDVAISETTEGADEGRKKVIAEITYDVSNNPDACTGWLYGYGAFDRDTGVYFRSDARTKEAVEIDGEYFDVRTEMDKVSQYPVYCLTYTLDCPADYDGAVFLFGYYTAEMEDEFDQIDFKTRLYTLDELPYDLEELRYFTLTDE